MADDINLVFSKCPSCGNTDTITKRLFKDIKIGMKEDATMALEVKGIPIPSSNGLVTGKVLVMLFDVCAYCGTYYMVASKVQQGQIQTKQQPLVK